MSKYIGALLIALFSLNMAHAKDKKYNVAIMITNPLSAYTKLGGGIEFRYRQSSIIFSGVNYTGVYAGKQYRFEYQKYIRTNKKNESFWYVKVCGGDATYDPAKMTFIEDNSKLKIGPEKYIGGGVGLGRRLNFNHFFLLFNFGVKYVAFPPDFPDESAEKFRVFYATGPGSILDCNLRLGFQF